MRGLVLPEWLVYTTWQDDPKPVMLILGIYNLIPPALSTAWLRARGLVVCQLRWYLSMALFQQLLEVKEDLRVLHRPGSLSRWCQS